MVNANKRLWRSLAVGALVLGCVVLLGVAALAGFFSTDPVRFFAPEGKQRPVGVLFFSGDMGLRFGMGSFTTAALVDRGFAITGLNSPTVFAKHRTASEVDAIVAQAVRQALAQTRSNRLILIGQSFGADILQTGLAHLPLPLRPKIAAVILVVPGDQVFFRADPTGLAYRGAADSIGSRTAETIDWAPLTCIYGADETDSLCSDIHLPSATNVRMPGGHFLGNDDKALLSHVLGAIRRAVPDAVQE